MPRPEPEGGCQTATATILYIRRFNQAVVAPGRPRAPLSHPPAPPGEGPADERGAPPAVHRRPYASADRHAQHSRSQLWGFPDRDVRALVHAGGDGRAGPPKRHRHGAHAPGNRVERAHRLQGGDRLLHRRGHALLVRRLRRQGVQRRRPARAAGRAGGTARTTSPSISSCTSSPTSPRTGSRSSSATSSSVAPLRTFCGAPT